MKRVTIAALLVSAVLVPAVGSPASALPSTTPSSEAGYRFAVEVNDELESSWVVPTVSCPTPDASVSFWLGLSDASTGRWMRIEVDADCRAGVPHYAGYLKASGWDRRSRLARHIEPGDVMLANLVASKGAVIGTLEDETARWGIGFYAKYRLAPDKGAVMTSERWSPDGALRPLADFSRVHYGDTTIDSKPVAGTVEPVVMRSRSGLVKATPSAFHRSSGAFAVTWLHE